MTTIAAYTHKDIGTAIAADRAMCHGSTRYVLNRSKIVKVGDWLVGVAGSTVIISILDELEIAGEWCPQTIADYVMDRMRERSLLVDGRLPSDLLVVREGDVWVVGDDGSADPVVGYAAVGSGTDYAMGVMAIGHTLGCDAYSVARKAVHAASCHDPYTDGEIDVEVMK